MANKIQFRRGTTTQRTAVVLDSGEPGWDTDQERLYVGDGVTAGGVPVADAPGTAATAVANHEAASDPHPQYTTTAEAQAIADVKAQDAITALRSDLASGNGASLVGYRQPAPGAVTRTQAAKNAEIISVKDFGAVGDGVADDTSAFQAAVNALTVGAKGDVLVPPGTYRLDSNVVQNGRYPVFNIQSGASFTGTGKLLTGAIYGPAVMGRAAFGGAKANEYSGVLIGGANPDEGGYGALLRLDGHANWLAAQTTRTGNPTEFMVIHNAPQGRATGTSGGSTLTWVSGTAFESSWVGRLIYWNRTFYTVSAVAGATLTLAAAAGGGAVPLTETATAAFHVVSTTVDGVCNTNGTAVTRVSGQPFIPFITTLTINGVDYTVSSWNSGDSVTLASSAGVQTGVSYSGRKDISAQLATIRVQKLFGTDEENLSISARASGEYQIAALAAGAGQYHPIRLATGEVGGDRQYLLTLHPGSTGLAGDGFVCIGGYDGAEALRAVRVASAVNRIDVYGATTGFAPSFRARGSDTNVSMAFDAQGEGGFNFTVNKFGAVVCKINGPTNATSYIELSAFNGTRAFVNARGSSADIDLQLSPKGAGLVRFGSFTASADAPVTGYITIKDAAGNTRKLAIIA